MYRLSPPSRARVTRVLAPHSPGNLKKTQVDKDMQFTTTDAYKVGLGALALLFCFPVLIPHAVQNPYVRWDYEIVGGSNASAPSDIIFYGENVTVGSRPTCQRCGWEFGRLVAMQADQCWNPR